MLKSFRASQVRQSPELYLYTQVAAENKGPLEIRLTVEALQAFAVPQDPHAGLMPQQRSSKDDPGHRQAARPHTEEARAQRNRQMTKKPESPGAGAEARPPPQDGAPRVRTQGWEWDGYESDTRSSRGSSALWTDQLVRTASPAHECPPAVPCEAMKEEQEAAGLHGDLGSTWRPSVVASVTLESPLAPGAGQG
ncbi:hypothetical protein H920_03574 [Fukomys damarensis]|uniref:Uncharacterized protein n=1 Tax=Fukomys damarensis TaxID=885580 RepID=A0A091DVD0_FUKDA|nr:hypothetical protein H920_03574 [Fukomys damarensis]